MRLWNLTKVPQLPSGRVARQIYSFTEGTSPDVSSFTEEGGGKDNRWQSVSPSWQGSAALPRGIESDTGEACIQIGLLVSPCISKPRGGRALELAKIRVPSWVFLSFHTSRQSFHKLSRRYIKYSLEVPHKKSKNPLKLMNFELEET